MQVIQALNAYTYNYKQIVWIEVLKYSYPYTVEAVISDEVIYTSLDRLYIKLLITFLITIL